MIQDTIVKINALIEQADRLTREQRSQLLSLTEQLQRDIQLIETVDQEQAQSVVVLAKLTSHEYLRSEQNPELIAMAEEGLALAIADYEKSHPKLYQTLQSLCIALRGLGV
ncbi:MAG: DUF4404 family protein [Methylococcales bacterium]|jgi:hypothetical protein|nr:hypothetical protein [Methylococcaceae bacterium]